MSRNPEGEEPAPYRSLRVAVLSVTITLLAVTLVWSQWGAPAADAPTLPEATMPAVKLARLGRKVGDAYRKDYVFTEDWFTYNLPVWEAALAPYKGRPNLRYLEVGLFEGRSLFWLLENVLTDPSSRATGLDIFEGALKDRYFHNLELSGCRDRVTTIIGSSQEELRKLPLGSFDIVYIDGSHSADDVLEDVILSWRLLDEGGLLILDDYRWHETSFFRDVGWDPSWSPHGAIDVFYSLYGWRFEVLHRDYQVILRKKPAGEQRKPTDAAEPQ